MRVEIHSAPGRPRLRSRTRLSLRARSQAQRRPHRLRHSEPEGRVLLELVSHI
jgi:hypothetical protein